MTEPSESDDGATPDGETARGAPAPEAMDGRETADGADEMPPEVSEADGAKYEDRYDEARGTANPDQHRDEEAYD